jgi:hypothetical protein
MAEFESFLPSLEPESVVKNAWAMRDEFFNLEKDTLALSKFLSRWGLWNSERGYEAELGKKPPGFCLAFSHLLWERREHYRRALAGKAREWLSTATPLGLSQINEPPYFSVNRSYCENAIHATLTIDHLSNVRFGICKREDCRKLFQRETQQKRFYCSPECAHLANVRKLRAQQKKTESKRRNHATRKD